MEKIQVASTRKVKQHAPKTGRDTTTVAVTLSPGSVKAPGSAVTVSIIACMQLLEQHRGTAMVTGYTTLYMYIQTALMCPTVCMWIDSIKTYMYFKRLACGPAGRFCPNVRRSNCGPAGSCGCVTFMAAREFSVSL